MDYTARQRAIEMIQTRSIDLSPLSSLDSVEIYGSHVFSKKVMLHYLSQDIYQKLEKCMESGDSLTRDIASPVANAIKAWAIDNGVTHFTHWFQPLTGLAAEKHESFLEVSEGEPIYNFSGEELIQQEPDASSFPHGGLRSTFEARGYTAWDSSSPVFIFHTKYGKTLCIPTIFVSFRGEALDYKIPLLRSISLLDKAATAVCQLFDKGIRRVYPTLGMEQEFFLIDEAFFTLRPDLLLTGRTLLGTSSGKDQQLGDHYFGAIPERVYAFMNQIEQEAHKIGIPLKTRHNEVAPGQYECAPYFEELNIAIDHGLMLMDIMDRVAKQHKFRTVFHEKPFLGINGSAKHNNWSLKTDGGRNLLSPGKVPRDNLMFLAFFTSIIRAVCEYEDLVRASVASAGNDQRLGGSEAPPPIISVFIGAELTKVLDDIISPPRKKKANANNPYLKLGISKIPELFLDNTDHNRTSPFAFTGKKFEFRAVGSAANSSNPMMVLNVIVADQLKKFHKTVRGKMNRGRKKDLAILDVIKENISASKAIRFEGNGNSDSWISEARKRGLSIVASTPEALASYLSTKSIKLFTSHKIFSELELRARYEVLMENYIAQIKIESNVLKELVSTQILPVAISYERQLLENIQMSKQIGMEEELLAEAKGLLRSLRKKIEDLLKYLREMDEEKDRIARMISSQEIATAYSERVLPYFDKIRQRADSLEEWLPDNRWPLPKYREMLFIK